eukprot:c16164_g1_i3.p1 GENE.c16164_g1_i3~~c16164_g1_i3.p1  ORF type:complete len:106 (-),score=15.94 c16164_g1_i3:236-553(-)
MHTVLGCDSALNVVWNHIALHGHWKTPLIKKAWLCAEWTFGSVFGLQTFSANGNDIGGVGEFAAAAAWVDIEIYEGRNDVALGGAELGKGLEVMLIELFQREPCC